MPKQPTPEHVHQLRTNTRRLEALLASLSLDGQEHRLLKDIGRIRKKAGGVRDMDVLINYTPAALPSEEQCRVRLLEHLGQSRRKKAKKLHSVTASKGQQARAALKRVDRRLEQALCENQKRNCDTAQARWQTTASALVLEAALAQPTRLTRENLHSYRLKVKQLQNVLRLGEGSKDQEFLTALGTVKDTIGEWHDWEELLGIAREVLDHGTRCKLIQEIRNASSQKFETAVAEAQKMRKKYLNASVGKRNGAWKRTAKPVWEATAAMAA